MSRKGSVFERLGGGGHRSYDRSASSEEGMQLCSYFIKHGRCSYGDNCKFSHDIDARGEDEQDLRRRMKRRRSESASPERRRRSSTKDKDKMKSTAVIVSKHGKYSSDEETSANWERPAGEEHTLDFKTELMLVKKRQELQRELKRLQDTDSAANSPAQQIMIEAQRTSSDSEPEHVMHKRKKKHSSTLIEEPLPLHKKKKEKKKKEKKREEKKLTPTGGSRLKVVQHFRTPSPEDIVRDKKKHKDPEKKKKVRSKTKSPKVSYDSADDDIPLVTSKKPRKHTPREDSPPEIKPIPYEKIEPVKPPKKSKEKSKKKRSSTPLYDDESDDDRHGGYSPEKQRRLEKYEEARRRAERLEAAQIVKELREQQKPKYVLPGSKRPDTPEGEYRRKRKTTKYSDEERSRSPEETRKSRRKSPSESRDKSQYRQKYHEEERRRQKAPREESRGRRRRSQSEDHSPYEEREPRQHSRSHRSRSINRGKGNRSPEATKHRERSPSDYRGKGRERQRDVSPRDYRKDSPDEPRSRKVQYSPDRMDYERGRDPRRRDDTPPSTSRRGSPIDSRSRHDQSDDRRRGGVSPDPRRRGRSLTPPDHPRGVPPPRIPTPPRDDYNKRGENREDDRYFNRNERDTRGENRDRDRYDRYSSNPAAPPERPLYDRYGNKIQERDEFDRGNRYGDKQRFQDRQGGREEEYPDRRPDRHPGNEREPPGRYYPNRDRNSERDLTPYERDRMRTQPGGGFPDRPDERDRSRGLDDRLRGPDERSRGPDERSRGPDERSRGPDERSRGPDDRPPRGAEDWHGGPDDRPPRSSNDRPPRGPDDRMRGPGSEDGRQKEWEGKFLEQPAGKEGRGRADQQERRKDREPRPYDDNDLTPYERAMRKRALDEGPEASPNKRRRADVSPTPSGRSVGRSDRGRDNKRDEGDSRPKRSSSSDSSRKSRIYDDSRRKDDDKQDDDRRRKTDSDRSKVGDRSDRENDRKTPEDSKASTELDQKQGSGGEKNEPSSTVAGEGYESISDDEEDWENILKGGDEMDVTEDKPKSVDILDIDWASLKKEVAPKPTTHSSALKRFTPGEIFSNIGVSRELAGDNLFEKVQTVCREQMEQNSTEQENTAENESIGVKLETGDIKQENPQQDTDNIKQELPNADVKAKTKPKRSAEKFEFLHNVAQLHASELVRRKNREALMCNVGPYRRALCARRDLQIRRELCKTTKNMDHIYIPPSVDPNLLKLSLQLLLEDSSLNQVQPSSA
ncbi:unnamed protein product [Owenia fusiformis]|uniref:Uncharacterized protein n=1 Tax=Owenia fusiformis TaxID=6347 RepID=A0A8J1T8S9_OWEFU|nr:unnamed protein product [Owenia fusiformis]